MFEDTNGPIGPSGRGSTLASRSSEHAAPTFIWTDVEASSTASSTFSRSWPRHRATLAWPWNSIEPATESNGVSTGAEIAPCARHGAAPSVLAEEPPIDISPAASMTGSSAAGSMLTTSATSVDDTIVIATTRAAPIDANAAIDTADLGTEAAFAQGTGASRATSHIGCLPAIPRLCHPWQTLAVGARPYGKIERPRPLLDRGSVIAFLTLWCLALVSHAPHLAQTQLWLIGPIALFAGYLAADFSAGLVHWLADRCFAEDTPWIGPLLIAPFRAHHENPRNIAEHGFFELSGNNALVCVPIAALLIALPPATSTLQIALITFGFSLSLALFATNQFHGWAHAKSAPRAARFLQQRGLILTPEGHARHHGGNHDRAYCVTSGWLNPLLDRVGFFERLERIVAARPRARRRAT